LIGRVEFNEFKRESGQRVSGLAMTEAAHLFSGPVGGARCACGTAIERKPGTRGPLPLACSDECHKARAAARWQAIKDGGPVRSCAECGNSFSSINPATVCCSLACGLSHARKSRGENARQRNARRCEQCGGAFQARSPSGAARRGQVQEGRFCNRTCAATWRRLHVRCDEVTA